MLHPEFFHENLYRGSVSIHGAISVLAFELGKGEQDYVAVAKKSPSYGDASSGA